MSEWENVRLGDICSLVSTKTAITNASIENYISTENMLPNFGGVTRAEKIPTVSTINTFLEKDILFSNIRTYFKKVWMAKFSGTVSSDVLVIRASSVCVPSYLNYLLRDPSFTEYTVLTSRGAKMPRGDKEAILGYAIELPPLPEQKAIAAVLSSLDDKIDLLHRQNKTLEAMAETLFRQWFIEEASEDWEQADISTLITIQSGYAFKSSDFKESGSFGVLKIKNINGSTIDIEQTDFVADDVGFSIADRFHTFSGDVLIAMTGAEIGKLGIVPKTQRKLLLNQRVGLLKPKFKGAEYLAYLHLKSDFGQDYIENSATGSAQPNISGSLIEECPFFNIDTNFLHQCGEQLFPYYEKLKTNLGYIQTLEKLRDTLLPKLMSGEVRVQYQAEQSAS